MPYVYGQDFLQRLFPLLFRFTPGRTTSIMAEALGAALGVVGVLAQIFDGCVKAYALFSTAASFDSDSQKLVCKIRIEEMRLVVWGREWGVAEGKLEKHLSRVDDGGGNMMRNMAVDILKNLHTTITDVAKLREKYGLEENENEDRKNGKGGKKGLEGLVVGNGKPESAPRKSSTDLRSVGEKMKGLTIRARWVVAGRTLTPELRGVRLIANRRQGQV